MPRHAFLRTLRAGFVAVSLLIGVGAAQAQCVSLTTLGSASTQNFDTLSNTAGSTTNNLTITGWFMTETGGGARDNDQYAVDTGGSTTGDTYSYGAAGSTERALAGLRSGTLIPNFGACFTNNTGATISSLALAFTGEQWRLGTITRTDQLNFEYSTDATNLTTGTWTAVTALNFVTPNTATAGAKDGNAAGNRTALSSTIPSLGIANGATFWIRWTDIDASGADDGLAVDDFSLTPQGGPPAPALNVNDITLAEGDAGTTTFTFTVSLTAPAGPGGVTFDIATANDTATAPSDFTAVSLTGQTIPAGSSTYAFNVPVNGDTTAEANETFFVNVTNLSGATAGDTQGLGTINNDDVTITPIHDIQGPGASSPIVGSSVTVRGVVTGVKSNGFFVQDEDAEVDADPATSEGIFVFTSSAPPAAAAFTALVQVTGTVTEFVPPADPLQPPVTELTSPSVVQVSPPGQTLPAPVALTPTFPDPAGPHDQLERVEGMRVSAASMTVVGPSQGSLSEANATATNNGRFHAVVTGVPRPFREPGIEAPNPPPTGSIPPIPRWDANPERLRVESATINAQPLLDVASGDVVANLTGPLDYGFRAYAIYPDGTAGTPAVTPATPPTIVTQASSTEFTIASYNLQRFYDTADDPLTNDVALTATAFANRLQKASLAIRNHLLNPDIVGVQEVENLSTLQALAAQISADAIAAMQPDPMYVAYLAEGNDVGGIDVGYLVKTATVGGTTPRVTVNSVTQIGLAATWIDPSTGTSAQLNDRPPLVLDAVVNRSPTVSFPVVVVNNHLRSLLGIEDIAAAGPTTGGDRVRRKRQIQADFLAQYLQGRLTAAPGEHLVVIGDMNAFEFNDGYANTLGTIMGTPSPDNETVVCATCPIAPNTGDGIDQLNPDLTNLVNTPPAPQRYSYVEDGNAQNIDHALVAAGVVTDTTARRIEHARVGADWPESARSAATSALRVSDHDPLIAYFTVAGFAQADLAITKTDDADPVIAGTALSYTIFVNNNGPDAANAASWSDTLPAGTTFLSATAPPGWSCTTPPIGAAGTVSCTNPTAAVGTAQFSLNVTVDPAVAEGTVLSNTATVSSATTDPDPSNNSATATTTVSASADLVVTNLSLTPTVNAGQNATFQIMASNVGPSAAASVSLTNALPAGTTFVSLSSSAGWSCTTPAVGAAGTVNCTIPSLTPQSSSFTLVLAIDPSFAPGTLSDTATIASATTDPNSANDSATANATVGASADLGVTNTPSTTSAINGQPITYTIVVGNAGPSTASTVSLTNAIPAGTTFTSLSSPVGWSCTTPAVGATGTVSCSIASVPPGGNATFSLTVTIDTGLPPTMIVDTASVTSATPDPTPGNDSATASTTTPVSLQSFEVD
ncbi:MAG TPA: Calx-beta domain-containing protein [Tahibacter sp.]|uniref:Calx-beta domain-containing protein n=1 Tax=Tahibacter sp. TaxID=2056211 RepID=UPI002C0B9F22|nr:Calx-beta domain-containing protein [Tahibacter sp.]HSX61761.1 Calx-beta domain-containing protein [Tahibacter sp.]